MAFRSATKHVAKIQTDEGEKEVTFYPLRYEVLLKAQAILGSSAEALSGIFGSPEERGAGFAKLLERLYADRRVVAEIVMDSMRGEFTRPVQQPDIKAFSEEIEGEIMVELLRGVWEANRRTFDPLVGSLVGVARAGLSAFLESRVASATATTSTEESQKSQRHQKNNGLSSKT